MTLGDGSVSVSGQFVNHRLLRHMVYKVFVRGLVPGYKVRGLRGFEGV